MVRLCELGQGLGCQLLDADCQLTSDVSGDAGIPCNSDARLLIDQLCCIL